MTDPARAGVGTDGGDWQWRVRVNRHPLGQAEPLPGGLSRLTFGRDYQHDVDALWRMLTDPAYTEQWWAQSRGEARTGERFDLRWRNGEPEPWPWWEGRVLAARQDEFFAITNSEHGRIEFALAAANDGGSRLRFTAETTLAPIETASALASWHLQFEHLHDALEGHPVEWATWWDRWYPLWERLQARYEARSGKGEEQA